MLGFLVQRKLQLDIGDNTWSNLPQQSASYHEEACRDPHEPDSLALPRAG